MDIHNYILNYKNRIDSFLDKVLPNQKNDLHMAMRYAALGGGKRFRPLLVYTTGETLNADIETLDYIAAAVEMVHCYSLIHDDLPAMDDDDIRRGRPSCHKAFGEATAILAGDALLSLAFETLTTAEIKTSPEMRLHIIKHLAHASGPQGMVLGQALDLRPDDITSIESITSIHLHKTGTLIQASVLMGAHAAECNDEKILKSLATFAQHLGLAFQIQDDILDLKTSAEHLTEVAVESDDHHSFPVLLGTESAQEEANRYYSEALDELKTINLQKSPLADLTEYMMNRKN